MSAAIHIELDALCLLLLCAIAYQSRKNVHQQMSRVLFRITTYGIILQLVLDILWRIVEDRVFPGAIFTNCLINALYLGLGCIWYLYVLETLGYKITRRLQTLVMLPGLFFMALNVISIWTGWIFTVSPENIYEHGALFWLQTVGAYGMLLLSFAHLSVWLLVCRNKRIPRYDIQKLFALRSCQLKLTTNLRLFFLVKRELDNRIYNGHKLLMCQFNLESNRKSKRHINNHLIAVSLAP